MSQWRIYKYHFGGAGKYNFNFPDQPQVSFDIDEHGIFESDDNLPLHAIAARVGTDRDRSY